MPLGVMGQIDTNTALYKLFGGGDPTKWAAIEAWLDAGGSLVDLTKLRSTPSFPTNGWDRFPKRIVASADGVTVTPSVANGRGVLTGTGGVVGNNHRELLVDPRAKYQYGEVRSIIYGGGTWVDVNNRTQQGHVHRAQQDAAGNWRAFAVTHDMAVGIPTGINCGVWGGTSGGAGFQNRQSNTPTLSVTEAKQIVFAKSSRATNVVTLLVPYPNPFVVGDEIEVRDTAGLDTTRATVTVIFGDVVQYSLAGADVPAGGPGRIRKVGPAPSSFPYILASRLIPGSGSSDLLQAKIWRADEIEPAWDSAGVVTHTEPYSASNPSAWRGEGWQGVLIGHTGAGETVGYGPIYTSGW